MGEVLSRSRKAVERAKELRQQNKELRAELQETRQRLRKSRAAPRRISPEITAHLQRDIKEDKKKPKRRLRDLPHAG